MRSVFDGIDEQNQDGILSVPKQVPTKIKMGRGNPGYGPDYAYSDHSHEADPSLIPQTFSAAGIAETGSTSKPIMSYTFPAQPVNGSIQVHGHALIAFSVAADQMGLFLHINGAFHCAWRINGGASAQQMAHVQATSNILAGVAQTIVLSVDRIGGAGTWQVFADPTYNRMDGLWIPRIA